MRKKTIPARTTPTTAEIAIPAARRESVGMMKLIATEYVI
jgi:hypothetical protein